MTPKLFRVRLLRACRLGDRLHLAGTVLSLPSADVIGLVSEARAVLVDHADMALLLDRTKANGMPWITPTTR